LIRNLLQKPVTLVVEETNVDFEASITQPSPAFLSLSQYSGTTPALITASFDISSLTEAKEYNATIAFTSLEVVDPISIPVSLTLTDMPTARVQVIHNCADLAVQSVDIWLNQERILSDFGFRSATPFVELPAGEELNIGVSLPQGASPDPNNILYTYNIPAPGLTADESYIAVASGLYDPSGYAANPDMLPLDFTLIIKENAKEDKPGVTFGYLSEYYFSMIVGEWIMDVTLGDDKETVLASFDFSLNSLGNEVGFLFSSGFLYPEENQNGPDMGLFLAFPDGTVHEFPRIIPRFISAEPDTIYYMASEDGTASFPQDMTIEEINGAEITYAASVDMESDWVTLSKESGTTPDFVTVLYDIEGLEVGEHYAKIMVTSEEAENSDSVIVALTIEPLVTSDADSLYTAPPVGGPPGATEIALPVTMVNNCDLYHFSSTVVTIEGKTVSIEGAAFELEDPVMPGSHTLMTLYFTIDEMAPEGFYPVVPIQPYPKFWMDCPEGGAVMVIPTLLDPELDGGVIVKSIPNYVCGYVVDPDGLPIEGAPVELWADFPFDGLEMSTASDETGFFEFNDFESMPYDLWGYKEGYYPDLVEDINYTDNGIMIVLAPVDPIHQSTEYVFFYCDGNTYLGAPMPIGSVVDAYNPDGIHCGTYFVTEEGKYRFMPVYRDDPTVTEKTGALPDEEIFFYINGMLAVATGEIKKWDVHLAEHEVCLDAGQMIPYTCELSEGWNLVSWPVDHPSDYILDALASIEGDYTMVAGFERGGLAYDPELEEFSTLWYVDHLSGYWIKAKYPTQLVIEGFKVPQTTPIPVTKGWNLVSYLPEENLAPDLALESILDILIVAQDDEGHTFVPDGGNNNYMDEMGPCQGYWLKVNDNGSLKYPGALTLPSAPQVNHNRIAAKGVPANLSTSNQWVNLYSRALSLNGSTIQSGAVITAYNTDGVKVGSFTMQKDGLFGFMPVYIRESSNAANSGVLPGDEFYLAVNGVKTNETFVWTENGDRIEIFNLTSKSSSEENLPESYGLEQNYPNPFNPTTTISFNLPTAGNARIEIFNVLGKLVAVPFNDIAQSGTTTVEWNGRNASGEIVSSGIYFYRLTADNYTETKKMTLLK